MRFLNIIKQILISPFLLLIKLYQWLLSPLLPSTCRHVPSCSEYALQAFRKHGVIGGLVLTTWRILRCNPWGTYGYDPVPLHWSLFGKNKPTSTKMFVTDYDGTLADRQSSVSAATINALNDMGKRQIVRVVATGRSMFSVYNVLSDNFPVDYIVFSAGIGVFDWQTKTVLHQNVINAKDTQKICSSLAAAELDFMVQLPVPENHRYYVCRFDEGNADLNRRVDNYRKLGVEPETQCPKEASQFVVICKDEAQYDKVLQLLDSQRFNFVRATSPIDGRSIWVEILPRYVSKATGIEFLRNRLNIDVRNIVVAGNDYYDEAMLDYVPHGNAFVVSNAPDELRERFQTIGHHDENAVAELLQTIYRL